MIDLYLYINWKIYNALITNLDVRRQVKLMHFLMLLCICQAFAVDFFGNEEKIKYYEIFNNVVLYFLPFITFSINKIGNIKKDAS